MKRTLKTLLIILSILSANVSLATESNTPLNAKELNDIINPPGAAALNIMVNALSSLKELRKQNRANNENVKTLIKIKFLPNLAINYSTQLTLKNHWSNLSKEQKYLFQRYITQSLIKDYAGYLGAYEQLESINISVSPNIKRKDNKAIVKLLISFDGNPKPFKVTLNMIHLDRWRIYDVRFLGVSIIKTYQAQFNAYIKRKGLERLIEKISKKLAKG
ncbi:MlaC/ttg2D family ABC transporter substrate-binding protein [Bathymodiolus septemdierum thioautotrophic gill symbiont]|uniref:Toluene tolerance protein n=1 Tax=endosymbiont of Bathymodiolus septemdierum str. Myojin knoll TaxID=1303921 RepID=A0A0P0URW3_9GAMM|nr:ABC transporter substrate-binding protein [Bathymodiolus septemdierum thioautotrophic gill symbiont]BAS67803.1 toluene tolerance protein [endosymbiont of Bathymodiolus septemdierum str. Myojin knoll]